MLRVFFGSEPDKNYIAFELELKYPLNSNTSRRSKVVNMSTFYGLHSFFFFGHSPNLTL